MSPMCRPLHIHYSGPLFLKGVSVCAAGGLVCRPAPRCVYLRIYALTLNSISFLLGNGFFGTIHLFFG